jgi:hypothetical protein
LLRGFARILLGESNSVKLRKEKNRGEKGFKISAGFIEVFNNNLFISKLAMFRIFLLLMSRSFF